MLTRHVWKEVETSGDRWKAKEESVLFFEYTPVIIISLAGKLS